MRTIKWLGEVPQIGAVAAYKGRLFPVATPLQQVTDPSSIAQAKASLLKWSKWPGVSPPLSNYGASLEDVNPQWTFRDGIMLHAFSVWWNAMPTGQKLPVGAGSPASVFLSTAHLAALKWWLAYKQTLRQMSPYGQTFQSIYGSVGQTQLDNPCMAACDQVYGAPSKNPDPAKLIACFVTQCAGSQSAPPTVVPPPGFTLPAGTVLPGGFTIPAGWMLPAGMQLPAGWNLPPGEFPPGWPQGWPGSSIPPGFTLPQAWTLPQDWKLPFPLTLPTALTVPPGVPVPPGLPSVPPPPQTGQPPLPPPPAPITPATEKKSDNTVLWVVGGVAAVAVVAVLVSSSKSIGGGMLAANPKGNEPWQFRASGMGRAQSRPSDFVGLAQLQRVPLRGDYDPGGAYWGSGGGPLYAAWDEDGNAVYLRASSRAQAKADLERRGIRFKR